LSRLLNRPEGHALLTWIGSAAALGIVLGLAVIPRATGAGSAARDAAGMSLYGKLIPSDGDGTASALSWVRERIRGSFGLALPDGSIRRVSYAELGVEIDPARLRQFVEASRDPGSALSRRRQQRGPLELPAPVRLKIERALATLLSLKNELDQSALDARLDLDHEAIIVERVGRLLDLDASLQAIDDALREGAEGAALVFEDRQPRRLASDLRAVAHGTLLGAFETTYEASPGASDRTFNLGRAASRLDGYVLMPGEELDFNAVVGPRDEANGYRAAKLTGDDEPLDGMNGSVCQVSGTLHAAALFSGLTVLERHPQTRPSSHIELGFDAAIAYPTLNLRLQNPYDFPVVLRETVAAGRVRAEVRGPRRPYTTTIIRKLDAATRFEEIQHFDASLPEGTRFLTQRGVPGLALHRYRIQRNGAHAVRESSVDNYPPTTQHVLVGVGSASNTTGRPPPRPRPEYLADELLVLSQSADSDAPLLEQRTRGLFGSLGWTKKIGSPTGNPVHGTVHGP
jgi:vancomycin resistance protein YoaR